ncbi:MAG: CapA family protein [Deltaproteobacteria bacterium]|nr:CapA family protein [Deltaproteobacteria bacterium]
MVQEKLKIAFCGDVMLGRGVNEVILKRDPSYVWGDVLALRKNVDLFAINLECVISQRGSPWGATPKVFHFRADPKAFDVLKAAHVNYVSLANNHTLDYGAPAMVDMTKNLKKEKISFSGAGRNAQAAWKPAIVIHKGYKIAFLSLTDNMPEWEATHDVPGVNYLPISLEEPILCRVQRMIDLVLQQKPTLTVLSIHWGPNMRTYPSKLFIEFAHRVMEMGIDIFHGHSAHVFQGLEIYRGKPIFYDTGDFLDDYMISEYIDEQMLYCLHYDGKILKKIELYPVKLEYARVNQAKGEVIHSIYDRIQKRSEPFGTKIRKEKERFVIDVF